mgnify:CR=1 FL=1
MIKSVNLSKSIFYILLIFLLINYLFPGSLIGYLKFGDVGRHPSLSDNPIYQPIPKKFYPIGDLINHFIFFFIFTLTACNVFLKNNRFNNLFYILLFLSVFLELFHLIIPNRRFEFYDIFANLSGVIFAYFVIVIYRFYCKNKI